MQFTAANKELNKAEKQVKASGVEVPGVAKRALEVTVAAILAANAIDHWRFDTEEPEKVQQIAVRLSKMVKTMLWFTDAELGWTDAYSRKGFLGYIKKLVEDWKASDCVETFPNVRVPTNGNGMGRPLVTKEKEDTNPAPKKKQMTLDFFRTGSTASKSSTSTSLASYFTQIHSKLDLRVKTMVQIRVTNLKEPQKVEHVVLSGASDMKKVHQLLAYLTGCAETFLYHPQKGSSVKGCRFELSLQGYK